MEVADPAKVGNPEVLAVEVALRTIWMSMTISLG
jgi:hypothetical protein